MDNQTFKYTRFMEGTSRETSAQVGQAFLSSPSPMAPSTSPLPQSIFGGPVPAYSPISSPLPAASGFTTSPSAMNASIASQTPRPSSSIDQVDVSKGFEFLQYGDSPSATPIPTAEAVDMPLSNTQYSQGDHHHLHLERHVHHFQELHVVGSVNEILDLRNVPETVTTVLPGNNVPQMRLRPDLLGRQALQGAMSSYFSAMSSRSGVKAFGVPILQGATGSTPYPTAPKAP